MPDVLADAGQLDTAGLVGITEFGTADPRGQPSRVRRERMLAIAHPDHWRVLEDAIDITGVTV